MKIVNRQYNRNYETVETYEAGIVLTGAEVKSVKAESLKLEDAFVKIIDNEVFLINADIPIYQFSRPQGYNSRRTRKLLLNKDEIIRLQTKLKSGGNLTMAPISCYNKGRRIKLEVALAKGRKDLAKRKLEKSRDIERDQKKEVKDYMKQ